MKQLLRTKSPFEIHEDNGHTLHRHLGPGALVALGIGVIIGTGIFVLTGTAAANYAGPALILSFVLAALACGLAGLCYAEMASMIPVSGSAYSYAYVTLGEFIAWFIGWNLMLEYLFASAAVAVGWSGYVVSLLDQIGLHLPDHLTHAPFAKAPDGHGLVSTGALLNFPAVFVVAMMSALCYVGIRQASWVNNIVVVVKLAVILLFIGFGLAYVDTAHWTPFIPENTGKFGQFGLSGIVTGAAVIFFAYIGFDCVSTAAQEAKNPQRDMPIGILGSLVICTVLYVAMTAVMTGMVPYTELNVPAPVALALDRYPELAWLAVPVKLGAIAGITSVILVLLYGQSRIFLTMSRDGLLPPTMGRVHPRFKTPHVSTLITGVCSAITAGLLPVDLLGEMVSIGTLLAFAVVCVSVLVLRYTRPELPRGFRTPWPWFTCLGGAGVAGYLMYALPADTWLRLVVWTLIGLGVYFLYGIRHSRLRAG